MKEQKGDGSLCHLFDRIVAFQAELPTGRGRTLRNWTAAEPGSILRDGRLLRDFASNDYLGLARHPDLKKRAAQWATEYGAGLPASRLITGNHETYQRLEERIASLKGTESALILSSGFQANASILFALLSTRLHGRHSDNRHKPKVQIFSDRLNHASFHFGIAAAGARQIRYRHNDLHHLQQRLQEHADPQTVSVIATESIFSMDGDQVDVAGIRDIAKRYEAFLYVDEAHATGVAGSQGMGLFSASSIDANPKDELVIGTFSKALGSFGAYVACASEIRDYLINTCAGFIYSTSLPPAVLGAIDAALDLVPKMDEARRHLIGLGDQLRSGLHDAGFDTLNSTTHIIPVVIGSDDRTMEIARQMEDRGLLLGAIRPPTVAEGSARLRISLSSAHSESDIDQLLSAFQTMAPDRPGSPKELGR